MTTTTGVEAWRWSLLAKQNNVNKMKSLVAEDGEGMWGGSTEGKIKRWWWWYKLTFRMRSSILTTRCAKIIRNFWDGGHRRWLKVRRLVVGV
jgi:hypothetical protein